MHLTQLLTNVQWSGDSSFAKEMSVLKMMSIEARHQKLTAYCKVINLQLKKKVDSNQSLKLILLELHRKLTKNSALTILLSFAFEANCKGEKAP